MVDLGSVISPKQNVFCPHRHRSIRGYSKPSQAVHQARCVWGAHRKEALMLKTLAHPMIYAILSVGCGTGTDPGPQTTICSEMTRTHCLQQAHCTLELTYSTTEQGERIANNGVYRCRDAAGKCELRNGLMCQEVEGCTMVVGECYCGCKGYGRTSVPDGDETEDCNCACGGEDPPGCVESSP